MLNVASPAVHLPSFNPGASAGHQCPSLIFASSASTTSSSTLELTVLPPATWQDPTALADAIKAAHSGVLVLAGAHEAPFASIGALFGKVTPELGARANAAYNGGGTRLVWKDAYGEGRGGPQVDEKRVIDLSAHRMQQLTSVDPGLAAELGSPLLECVAFFDGVTASMAPIVLAALREATGCKAYSTDEARFAYRLVEYGLRAGSEGAPPRCGSHRDFGTATLIWRDAPGLEVRVGSTWQALPQLPASSAVLLFGLCTAWRSNDRIRAAEHRVVDCRQGPDGAVPCRRSAVLFMGLCDDALLSPSLTSPHEAPRYTTARVGAVHPVVRRKWSWREGSVTAQEAAAEEQERAQYPTQEALIAALYKLV